jgi:hypothetical protein
MRHSSSHSPHYLKCAEAPPRGHDTETLQLFSMVDTRAWALGPAIVHMIYFGGSVVRGRGTVVLTHGMALLSLSQCAGDDYA